MEQTKIKVFISYSRQDSAIVTDVVSKLDPSKFSVWIDTDGVESGDAFKTKIVKAIENSQIVVFFSSASSNASYWVTKEISIAIDEHKKIIPIKLDGAKYNSEIKFDLVNLDFIDMSNLSFVNDGINRLIKSISNTNLENLNKSNTPSSTSPIHHTQKSVFKILLQYKGCLISLTVCLVAIVLLPAIIFSIKDSSDAPPLAEALGQTNSTNVPDESDLLAELPVAFSKDGFILDLNIEETDCIYAICDSTVTNTDNRQDQDESAPSEQPAPKYIQYMERGIEFLNEKDYKNAYNQFSQAASLGSSDAMYNLAISHLTGLGAEVDTIRAKELLSQARSHYHQAAKIKLESLNATTLKH